MSPTPSLSNVANAAISAANSASPSPGPPPDFGELLGPLAILGIILLTSAALVLAFRRGFIFSTPKRGGDPPDPLTKPNGAGGPPKGADKADLVQPTEGDTFVRSGIALWLVLGLLMLAVLSFAYGNENLQSTIFGAVTVSAGGAIAFYFSTKAASEARRDLMQVADGLVFVPDPVTTAK